VSVVVLVVFAVLCGVAALAGALACLSAQRGASLRAEAAATARPPRT